jgi:hypothetical protein
MAKRVTRPHRASANRSRARRTAKPASERVVRQTVKGLERELRRLTTLADKALRQFEAIRLDGAVRYEEQLVRKAVKDGLFTDLAAFQPTLATAVDPSSSLAPFRSVPAALLIWASSELHLEPILKVGQEGEMSADAASKYDWTGESASCQRAIIAFRVVDPGWKWRGRVLARPRLVPLAK